MQDGWRPLSHGQEALWFLSKLAPESWAYNLVMPLGVRGDLDEALLTGCLQALSDRHPCLRMELDDEGGTPRQRPLRAHTLELEVVDACDWSSSRLDDAVRDRARHPFDLVESAALRATLFRRSARHHVLVLVVHHIVSDLWSLVVLMDELESLYAARTGGEEARLPALGVTYLDHVERQRRRLDDEEGEKLWRYWKAELEDADLVLDLPSDRSRPPMPSFRGGTLTRTLSPDLTRRLKRAAGEGQSTLHMALLAAFHVLLYRYTGQPSIVVGSPTAGRTSSDLDDVFGYFVNMVPLRADLDGDPTFLELLTQTRQKVVGAIEHPDYPFALLADRLQTTRDPSRSPIFQVSFVLQKFQRYHDLARAVLPTGGEARIPFADLWLEPMPLAQQDGQFDLTLEMKEQDSGGLVGAWKYASDLFRRSTISLMAGHFETLLEQIVEHPDLPISRLSLLDPDELGDAVSSGRGEALALPPEASVAELFQAEARRDGSRIAVSCGDEALTYSELLERARGLASALRDLGVEADVLITVLMPRGLGFVTSLLSVSMAGGAFLPMDPRHPASRLASIMEKSGTPLVLTTRATAEIVRGVVSVVSAERRPRVIVLEDLPRGDAAAELPLVRAGDLAYVMYTSGSTGEPKGVMVEHRGMVNHVLAKLSDLEMRPDCALVQNGPQSFDIVVWQCLAPLVLGGRVVVFPDEVAEDPALLFEEVERRGATVLQIVPSMLRALLDEAQARAGTAPELSTLEWMVPTGEALPTELCRRWLALYPGIPVLNTYGSTECSDDQCHHVLATLTPADEVVAVASIGTPIQNLTAHVLDRSLSPVPAGVVGELYIGGVGVGRGYRNDPARTAASFVPDPLGSVPGARLYRTRDLARRRPDGALDFLGRIDHMIKLRGFRIEPEEIEAALTGHPGVADASVVARPHPSGEGRLVGYVVRGPEAGAPRPEPDELRQYLAGLLPPYMVPTSFCFVEALPLTANGKLDQRGLPEPEWRTEAHAEYVAPRTPTEEVMAAIWAEVLGLERVGVTEDFFALGGDSIVSIQIVARSKHAGLRLRPSDIFLHQTVAELAAVADADTSMPTDGAATTSELPPLQVSQQNLELALGQVEFDE